MLSMADTMVELKCAGCGEDFERRVAEVNRQKKKGNTIFFCGRSCSHASHVRIGARDCLHCGNNFKPEYDSGKYCSRSCATSANNALKPKRVSRISTTNPEGKCTRCGVQRSGRYATYHKYCSSVCSTADRMEVLILAWLKDEVSGSGKAGDLRAVFRKYLLKEADHKCIECGWGKPNPVTGKPILSVDHVDGNWQNNKRSNLKVLCYNCHTLTPTFGSLNKTVDGTRPRGVRAYPSQNGALKVVDRETQAKVN